MTTDKASVTIYAEFRESQAMKVNDALTEARHQPISGDRPIEAASDDRLGFGSLAERLAHTLVNQSSTDGLVVGLEGRWGSGKSSLLNLTVKAFRDLAPEVRPVVVEFKPWLIRDRDALLASFFDQLAGEIEKVELSAGYSDIHGKRQGHELAKRVRDYAAKAETLGALLSVVPIASHFGVALKGVGAALKNEGGGAPLQQLKQDLDTALAKMPCRIVVTIDDVDRLEPREVVELLRLVRSVADFRNVIYVLCYDGDILARGIERGVHIDDGHAYLEKIVQVSVAVPIPEPFHLRRWFQQELAKLATTDDEATNERLTSVVDREGGRRLTTPRAVIRSLNALSLLAPSLKCEVDLPDLIWLQLIKTGNHPLYRWIEGYCSSSAAATGWRVSVSEESKKRSFAELQELLAKDHVDFDAYRFELDEHLPGIATLSFQGKEDEVPIHRGMGRAALDRAIRDKRLASPDHYRLYFALTQPQLAPRAADFERLLNAANTSAADISRIFIEWAKLKDPTVSTKADVMLDRMCQRAAESLSPEQAERIFLGLADCMDEAGAIGDDDEFGTPTVWREAQRCIPELRKSMGAEKSLDAIKQAFGHGESLGWLTALLRHEIFGHGRFGERRTRESDWLVTDPELDAIIDQMLSRYRRMSLDQFFDLPKAISALFAWAQAGEPEGPRRLIQNAAVDDAGLVGVLERMTNLVRSSRENYVTLSRGNLDAFLDYDQARSRIEVLAANSGSPLQERAAKLKTYFEAAAYF